MNRKDNKVEIFETMPIGKAVVKLAVPTVMACLVMVIYNLADTFFVGKLNDSVQTAAVTLAAPVILAFNAVNNMFGTGGSSLMSRALGVKDYELVKKSSAFSIWGALIFAALFSLCATCFADPLLRLLGAEPDTWNATKDYLFWTVTCGAIPAILNVVMGNMVRAEGAAMHASVGMMSGCLLNIIIDPFFILPWGLNMGAAGAGLATFISNCVACLYLFGYIIIKRGRTFVSVNPAKALPTLKVVKEVFGVGIPASIQNLLNVTGMTILNNAVATFGTAAISAMGISHKVVMIPMYVAMGISQGVMPLVGYTFAAKMGKRMKSAILCTARLAEILIVMATAGYFIFAENIIHTFMSDALVVEYGTAFIRGMCLAQPFLSLDFLAVGIFQACGMGQRSLVFSILRKIVLEIPAIYLLNYLFPMYGLAYSQLVAEFILAIAAVICISNILKKYAGEEPQLVKSND